MIEGVHKERSLRILGIDPGFARLGYAVLDFDGRRFQICDFGCIETSPKTPFPERLVVIYDALNQILDQYSPEQVAIEQLFFARNTTTAIAVAEARGVAVLAGARRQLPVFQYTPVEVKSAVVGYGKADKQQVQNMTCQILGLRRIPQPDDAADALAIAICHGHSSQGIV